MLLQLPDLVKADPIIFIGTSSIVDRVVDFLNELLRLSPKYPRELVFLNDDPTVTSPSLINLAQGNFELHRVDCQIRDLGNELRKEQLELNELPLFSHATGELLEAKALKSVSDTLNYVPRKSELKAHEREWNRLLDTLFRPSYLNWEPYALRLPFKRDFEEDIIQTIKAIVKEKSTLPKAVWVTGESGIGKTTTLRNCAFNMPSFETRESLFIEGLDNHQEKGIWIPGGRFDDQTIVDKDSQGKLISQKKESVKKRLLLFVSASLVN